MADQEESFYDADTNGERYIILSDLQQQMPAGRLKVTGFEKRTNSYGKEYPVLFAEEVDSGDQFTIAAWKRDVRACLKEWGGKKPTDWGFVTLMRGKNRVEIVPAADQTPAQESI